MTSTVGSTDAAPLVCRKGGRRVHASGDDGFTVLELLMAIAIIAILVATAVPAFSGARKRANARVIEANLRTTLTSGRIYKTSISGTYSGLTATGLSQIETEMKFADGLIPSSKGSIYVSVNTANVLFMSGKSKDGICYYEVDDPVYGLGYHIDTGCGSADSYVYSTAGW